MVSLLYFILITLNYYTAEKLYFYLYFNWHALIRNKLHSYISYTAKLIFVNSEAKLLNAWQAMEHPCVIETWISAGSYFDSLSQLKNFQEIVVEKSVTVLHCITWTCKALSMHKV